MLFVSLSLILFGAHAEATCPERALVIDCQETIKDSLDLLDGVLTDPLLKLSASTMSKYIDATKEITADAVCESCPIVKKSFEAFEVFAQKLIDANLPSVKPIATAIMDKVDEVMNKACPDTRASLPWDTELAKTDCPFRPMVIDVQNTIEDSLPLVKNFVKDPLVVLAVDTMVKYIDATKEITADVACESCPLVKKSFEAYSTFAQKLMDINLPSLKPIATKILNTVDDLLSKACPAESEALVALKINNCKGRPQIIMMINEMKTGMSLGKMMLPKLGKDIVNTIVHFLDNSKETIADWTCVSCPLFHKVFDVFGKMMQGFNKMMNDADMSKIITTLITDVDTIFEEICPTEYASFHEAQLALPAPLEDATCNGRQLVVDMVEDIKDSLVLVKGLVKDPLLVLSVDTMAKYLEATKDITANAACESCPLVKKSFEAISEFADKLISMNLPSLKPIANAIISKIGDVLDQLCAGDVLVEFPVVPFAKPAMPALAQETCGLRPFVMEGQEIIMKSLRLLKGVVKDPLVQLSVPIMIKYLNATMDITADAACESCPLIRKNLVAFDDFAKHLMQINLPSALPFADAIIGAANKVFDRLCPESELADSYLAVTQDATCNGRQLVIDMVEDVKDSLVLVKGLVKDPLLVLSVDTMAKYLEATKSITADAACESCPLVKKSFEALSGFANKLVEMNLPSLKPIANAIISKVGDVLDQLCAGDVLVEFPVAPLAKPAMFLPALAEETCGLRPFVMEGQEIIMKSLRLLKGVVKDPLVQMSVPIMIKYLEATKDVTADAACESCPLIRKNLAAFDDFAKHLMKINLPSAMPFADAIIGAANKVFDRLCPATEELAAPLKALTFSFA